MRVAGNANYTMWVTHSQIVATLGEGCGAGLPVQVTVGGQASTCADTATNGAACTISFPVPALNSVVPASVGFNVTSLSTLGGQRVYVWGSNLAPARSFAAVGGGPISVKVRCRCAAASLLPLSDLFAQRIHCSRPGSLCRAADIHGRIGRLPIPDHLLQDPRRTAHGAGLHHCPWRGAQPSVLG